MKPTPIPIDPELAAKLTQSRGEVSLAAPDGTPVGYFLSPDQYAVMRQALNEWLRSPVTEADCRRALAKPGRHSTDEVFKLLGGD